MARRAPSAACALFYRQIVAELRKVVWPTRSQLSTYTTVVIVFAVIMIGLVTVIDYGFNHSSSTSSAEPSGGRRVRAPFACSTPMYPGRSSHRV